MTLSGEERESVRTGVVAEHYELLEESVLRGDFDVAVAMRARDLGLVDLHEETLEAIRAQERAWKVIEGVAAPWLTDQSDAALAHRDAVVEYRRLRAVAERRIRRGAEALA